ncbi:MAG: hypothetical protein QM813_16560 [Verrucomicrobiota bacterium]
MGDFGTDFGFAGDAEDFVESGEDLGVFVAHVAGVNAVVGRDDFGEFDDFVGLGKCAGEINEAGGEADGAVFHGLFDVAFHFGEFFSRGWAIEAAAHGFLADGIVADERADVGRDAIGGDGIEEFRDVQGRATAVADDESSDAHAEEVFGASLKRFGVGIADFIGVSVDVNEARRDDEACGVDLLVCCAGNLADLDDAAVFDGDVGEESGVARAIHDAAMADDGIELRCGRVGDEPEEKQTG